MSLMCTITLLESCQMIYTFTYVFFFFNFHLTLLKLHGGVFLLDMFMMCFDINKINRKYLVKIEKLIGKLIDLLIEQMKKSILMSET